MMIRMPLIGYLAIVITAGPALCCCSMSLAPAAFADSDAPESAPCCCQDSTRCTKDKSKKQSPSHDHEKCPCRQSATCCGLLPPATKPTDSSIADWLTYVTATVNIVAIEAWSGAHFGACLPGVASHRPFWDPSDLLDLHHRLRC